MSIKRIDISIKDNKWFGLITFLVDRSDFLADIEEARNLLELKSFPYTFPNFSYKKANNIVNYYKQGVCNIYDVYSVFKDICKEKNIFPAELDITLASAYVLAKSLAKKYHKSGVYIPVILSSILTGEVKEGDILPTNIFEIGKQNIETLDERFKDNGKSMSIIVNSESTLVEVKNIFRSIQKLKSENHPKIRNMRDWYWRKTFMSWNQLYNFVNESKTIKIPNETIRTAVRTYKDILQKN